MGLGVGPDPGVASFSRPWCPVGVPGIRCAEQKVSRVLDFEHSIEGMCDSSTLAAPQIPKVSIVLDFEQSIQHSIEGMCDSSTLGAPRVPKVSRVLHFEQCRLRMCR